MNPRTFWALIAFLLSFPLSGLAQDGPKYRLIVAAASPDPAELALVTLNQQPLALNGHPPGFATLPLGAGDGQVNLKAWSGDATPFTKMVTVSGDKLLSLVVYQEIKRNSEGKITSRKYKMVELPAPDKGRVIEVVSLSARASVPLSINGVTRNYAPGNRVRIPKLSKPQGQPEDDGSLQGKPLVIKAGKEELYADSVDGRGHLLIVIFDGPDGKPMVAVADA